MLPLWKRILRWMVKGVAAVAALVFFFDNKLSGTSGTVLLCSIIVLFLCLFVWLIFGLSGNEDSGCWPNKPQ